MIISVELRLFIESLVDSPTERRVQVRYCELTLLAGLQGVYPSQQPRMVLASQLGGVRRRGCCE